MNRLFSLSLSLLLLITCTACVGRAAAPSDEEGAAAPVTTAQSLDTVPSDGLEESSEEPAEEAEEPDTPYVRVIDPALPMVALTFDDGPHGTCSDELLDILEKNHALATFFEVGKNVAAYPDPVKRMADMGCEVASHSYAHKDLSKLKKKALLQDLDAADAAFVAAGVDAPTLVRPPYGAVNSTVKSSTGRAMVTWTVDTEDWKSRNAQTVIDYVQSLDDLDGEIILMHSIYQSTVDAAEVLVPWLQEQGYQLVTVTELMAYYYGELPQPDSFYGYTYFTTHGRTDTPVPLPGEEVPGAGIPDPEAESAADAGAPEEGLPEEASTPAEPAEEPEQEKDWEPVRVVDEVVELASSRTVPNPAMFNP